MSSSKEQRIVWADALRGLLILLVVIGHSLQFGNYENRLSWNIIYSFHMAAFFVISGYVGYKSAYRFSSLSRKASQLLLPFVSWTFLGILIKGGGISRLVNVVLRPDNSYWFIYVLFVIIVLFITLVLIANKYDVNPDKFLLFGAFLLIITMVVTEFRLLGFQFISYYFGFYVLGYLLRKYNIVFSAKAVILLGLVWLSLAVFWKMHAVPVPLKCLATFIPSSLLNYSYRYVAAIFGSLFFMSLAMRVFNNAENRLISLLCYFGKVSLGLYIIHLFIGEPVYTYYRGLLSSDTSIAFVLLDSVTRIVISLVLINIIQRIPMVRLLLLGKK